MSAKQRRSGPRVAQEAASSVATDKNTLGDGSDPREQARHAAHDARLEVALRTLTADVQAGCRDIRDALARGDVDEARRRQLVLDAVANLEVAAIHRAGAL